MAIGDDFSIATTGDIRSEVLRQVEAVLLGDEREEVPEVFELQPLEERRVMARVRSVAPATFYFAGEDDAEELDR